MKRIATGLLTAVAITCLAVPAFAQTGSLSNAKIALHVKSHAIKASNTCSSEAPLTVPCSAFVTEAELNTSYDMYIIVANGNLTSSGVAGMSFGIAYDGDAGSGMDVFGWTPCSILQFPGNSFPAAGGGNVLTWDGPNCQNDDVGGEGIQAIGGAFYVYAYGPDTFSITKRLFIPQPDLALSDCGAAQTDVPDFKAGFVKFSAGATDQGCNPCLTSCAPVPVQETTWGKIKSTYGSGD